MNQKYKVGDRLIIYQKYTDNIRCSWMSDMDQYVGVTATVSTTSPNGNYKFKEIPDFFFPKESVILFESTVIKF